MSMVLYIYAVKLDHLWSAFGSSDQSLLNRIRATSPDKYRIQTWHYETFGREQGDISVDEAIEGILNRSIIKPECAGRYGIALELLCELLGTELPNDEFTGLHRGLADIFGDAGLDCAAARILCNLRHPLPLPPCEDGPLISCLTHREVVQSLESVVQAVLLDQIGSTATEQDYVRARFHSWLQHAKTQQSDLVTFFY